MMNQDQYTFSVTSRDECLEKYDTKGGTYLKIWGDFFNYYMTFFSLVIIIL